jgi:chromosome segregation ATPase
MSTSTLSTLTRTEAPSSSPTPGLIVMFGASANKKLLLNRPAIVVGSGSVCDIKLKTPDIGEVHALIIQTPEGLLLRDCKSATGTLVNGTRVEEVFLHNDDVLQFGTFQFKARVPEGWPNKTATTPPAETTTPAPHINGAKKTVTAEELETLEQKRRRLTQMAWARRNQTQYQAKQLQDAQVRIGQLEAELRGLKTQRESGSEQVAQQQAQWEQQRQEQEARLKQAQEELSAQEKVLAEERQQQQAAKAQVEQAQQELERRRTEFESQQASWKEQQAALEKQHQELRAEQEKLDAAQAEREKQLQQLGEEETLFRAEVAKLKAEVEALTKERDELTQKHAGVKQEATQIEQRLEAIRAEEKQLQEQCVRLREEQTLANKPLEERRAYLQQLEDTLRQQQEAFEQQKRAWEAARATQESELEKLRGELQAKETQFQESLSHLEEQNKAHSRRQQELDRLAADLKEEEADVDRQRQAIQRETEMWLDQRNTLAGEVTARQEEIEMLVNRCKELKVQESRLEASNAEWNAHLEKETRDLEQQRAKLKTDAEAEVRKMLEKERKSLDAHRERIEAQISQLYAQTEIHLAQCLNLLQTERERFGELRQEYSPTQT